MQLIPMSKSIDQSMRALSLTGHTLRRRPKAFLPFLTLLLSLALYISLPNIQPLQISPANHQQLTHLHLLLSLSSIILLAFSLALNTLHLLLHTLNFLALSLRLTNDRSSVVELCECRSRAEFGVVAGGGERDVQDVRGCGGGDVVEGEIAKVSHCIVRERLGQCVSLGGMEGRGWYGCGGWCCCGKKGGGEERGYL